MAKAYVAEGALFRDAPVNDGKTRPVMHVALTVLGVKLDLAVWPKETGRNGTAYWPVTGQYGRNETGRPPWTSCRFSAAGRRRRTARPVPRRSPPGGRPPHPRRRRPGRTKTSRSEVRRDA